MARLRNTDIDSPQDSIYGCGQCHVFAIAAAMAHDPETMRFLVVEDHDELMWINPDDPDDYMPAVLHVYSLHETDLGLVARDILGDRLAEAAEEECRDMFDAENTSSTEVDLETLKTYIQGNEDDLQIEMGLIFPLAEFRDEDVKYAMQEEAVICSLPGREVEPTP